MSATRRLGWRSAAAIGLAALVAWIVWTRMSPSTPLPTRAVTTPVAAALSPSTPAPVALTTSPDGADTSPPGVTAAQWQQLRAEMAAHANGAAELSRLRDYFIYTDTLQRFRKLRTANPSDPGLAAMARNIDAGIDEHLKRNEMSLGEARLVKMATLDVLVPDDAGRQAQLAQWQQDMQTQDSASPEVADAQVRDASFKRQQAAVVAAWSAQAPAQRSTQQLGQQLETLRHDAYSTH